MHACKPSRSNEHAHEIYNGASVEVDAAIAPTWASVSLQRVPECPSTKRIRTCRGFYINNLVYGLGQVLIVEVLGPWGMSLVALQFPNPGSQGRSSESSLG